MRFYFSYIMITALVLAGCSPRDWAAKFYVVKAENAMDKAANLRSKKIPFEKRISFYEEACENFVRAFESDPEVFTLTRIEAASESCWKANSLESEALFKQFEEAYIKTHPQEYEYGDSGVGMMEMS